MGKYLIISLYQNRHKVPFYFEVVGCSHGRLCDSAFVLLSQEEMQTAGSERHSGPSIFTRDRLPLYI